MPYSIKKRRCKQSDGSSGKFIVIKTSNKKKKSCHTSRDKAEKSINATYANKTMQEIKDYFKQKEEGYLEFDGHPLASIEDLMDPTKPAPWDHLTNTPDDEDVDIEIEERIKK